MKSPKQIKRRIIQLETKRLNLEKKYIDLNMLQKAKPTGRRILDQTMTITAQIEILYWSLDMNNKKSKKKKKK